jgi:hypothetical protein
VPEQFGIVETERVMSLEDIFLSREFGRVPRAVPLTAPTRHSLTTHRRRGRGVGAAGGIAAALVLAVTLAASTGKAARSGGLRALGGSTPMAPSRNVRIRAVTLPPAGEPPASSTGAAPAPAVGGQDNTIQPAALTASLRTDPGRPVASAPEPPTTPNTPTSAAPSTPTRPPTPTPAPPATAPTAPPVDPAPATLTSG